uniref:Microtubule associated tyrosine carboxypeptidase 2 n=1 Tax=Laticauda laticaudata TaxID=8630 RepID=A0A8C5WU00_LATLA
MSRILKWLRLRNPVLEELELEELYCHCTSTMKLHSSYFIPNSLRNGITLAQSISITGNSLGLSTPPKNKSPKHFTFSLGKAKQLQTSKSCLKDGDAAGRKLCILTAIKPSNVEREKIKFFKSDFTSNPQFEYASSVPPCVLEKYSQACSLFLKQAIRIMELTLQKYGSYENFEQSTGGSLLPRSRIWNHVRKYMAKEGCLGKIVVHLSEDLLSRASMTVVNGRPTLTINISTAREHWLEGMLRHEIGTHYLRGINNNSQLWNNWSGRRKHGLKPINPTEEGLASIHSVLFRKDPFLWRAALLYYTVYQASQMSFRDLFQDIGKFVTDPNTRWDYCVRAKRGWTDTSQPGCFSKDQVYLDGILRLLRYRHSIDFYLLTALGKVIPLKVIIKHIAVVQMKDECDLSNLSARSHDPGKVTVCCTNRSYANAPLSSSRTKKDKNLDPEPP